MSIHQSGLHQAGVVNLRLGWKVLGRVFGTKRGGRYNVEGMQIA